MSLIRNILTANNGIISLSYNRLGDFVGQINDVRTYCNSGQ